MHEGERDDKQKKPLYNQSPVSRLRCETIGVGHWSRCRCRRRRCGNGFLFDL